MFKNSFYFSSPTKTVNKIPAKVKKSTNVSTRVFIDGYSSEIVELIFNRVK